MNRSNYLFNELSWHSVQEQQLRGMTSAIQAMAADQFLKTPVADLATYFQEKFQVAIPVLSHDAIEVDQREIQIDVSNDHNRMIFDRSRPFFVTGTEVVVEVPFSGEAAAFRIQPSTYGMNPPIGEVAGSRLILRISGQGLTEQGVRTAIESALKSIDGYLDTLRSNAAVLMGQLKHSVGPAVEARRQKLLADRNLVGNLGFRMKARPDAARTFPAPEVRRNLQPTLPPTSSSPFKPEPALEPSDYEHILSVMQDMTEVMERAPAAFTTMDEETLRSHFLVQLNGHYGGQATGETFNFEGKTDILVRSGGKNIFIAECKFWSGPKKHTETIDQLLGYTAWRDTKTAVVVFNRNRDFTKVLRAIDETSRAHPHFKRAIAGSAETMFRYVFSHRDDASRELYLTVMAFDVPHPNDGTSIPGGA